MWECIRTQFWIQDKIALICLLNGVISLLFFNQLYLMEIMKTRAPYYHGHSTNCFVLLILQFTFSARSLSHGALNTEPLFDTVLRH